MADKQPSIKQRSQALRVALSHLASPDDARAIQLLDRLCHQLALAQEAQATIEKEGLTIETATTTKTHPAISIGHNATLSAIKLLNALGIDGGEEQEAILDLD